MAASPARRHELAVELLDIGSSHLVLEIGCGHGIATGLAAAALTTGTLVAVDRSTKMTAACAKRNAADVASGRVRVMNGNVEELAFPHRFDRTFAVNVDFPRHDDLGWAAALKRLLKPEGIAVLVLEAPAAATAERFASAVASSLTAEGLKTEVIRRSGLVAVRAFR